LKLREKEKKMPQQQLHLAVTEKFSIQAATWKWIPWSGFENASIDYYPDPFNCVLRGQHQLRESLWRLAVQAGKQDVEKICNPTKWQAYLLWSILLCGYATCGSDKSRRYW
jgi:hypothetical protein